MNVQAHGTMKNTGYGTSVRDILVAKAIRDGYNPYCRSTDAKSKCVTDEMRAKTRHIRVPESTEISVSKQTVAVREVAATPAKKEHAYRKEIVTLENFELVARRSASLSLGMVVSVLVTAMVLAMVVFSGSFINEETRRYSELNDTIAVLKEEDKTLTIALEEKNDLEVIEDIAVNKLGMVAANPAEYEYLSLSAGDSIKVYDVKKEDTSMTVNLLNTFSEKISSFLEYLD